MDLLPFVRVEGPILPALIKAVDAISSTVTIATRVGRGETAEEKTLPLVNDIRVVIDNNESKFADIKVFENGPFAMLRLSLDQKAVQSIQVGTGR